MLSMRALTIASIAALVQLIIVLLHYIYQEIYATKTLQQKTDNLIAEARRLHLSKQQWQQVYGYAKASSDIKTFLAHLRDSNLIASKDYNASLVLATPGTADTPAALPAAGAAASQLAGAGRDRTNPLHVGATSIVAPAQQVPHPQITKEMAWKHARENVIIVTWTNYHFLDFVENWALHLSNHHIQNYLIGAMDRQTADRLAELGLYYFAMFSEEEEHSGLGAQDFGWGSGKFHLMGRQKISLLSTFLGFGLDIMLCDSDTVWINDPTDYFNRFPAADILTSSDHMFPTIPTSDDGLEMPDAVHSAMNIGVMFFRHSEHTKAFVQEWVHVLDKDPKMWDQNAFNMLARSGFDRKKVHESNPRLFWGYNGRLVMGILPVSAFASGHTYHVQHLYQVMEVKPYVVHQTFQYGGTKGKRHRLREAQLWYDSEAYYRDDQFLHLELDQLPAPPNFQDLPDFNMSLFHLQNMEHQLLQLREAFAVALITNRTIVMPKLQCYCDRYWGPVWRCRLPGASKLQLPFICPLDHIFEPFHFDDNPAQFGPPLSFREHSFFENERTPDSVKNDVLTVKIDHTAPSQSVIKEDDYHWRVGANANYEQVRSGLGTAAAKIIRLEFDQQPTFRTHKFFLEPLQPAQLQDGFMRRIAHMPGFWCCRQPNGPKGKGGTPYMPMIMGKGIEHRG